MSRLIDADVLIEMIKKHSENVKCSEPSLDAFYQMAHEHIIGIVDIQPIAYDVEKVVEELKKQSRIMMPVIPTEEAIDIVRKGGIE